MRPVRKGSRRQRQAGVAASLLLLAAVAVTAAASSQSTPVGASDREAVGRRDPGRTVLPGEPDRDARRRAGRVAGPATAGAGALARRPPAPDRREDGRAAGGRPRVGQRASTPAVAEDEGRARVAVGERAQARQGRPAQLHGPALLAEWPARLPERRQRQCGRLRRGPRGNRPGRRLVPPAQCRRAAPQGGDPRRPRAVAQRQAAVCLRQPVEQAARARRGRRASAARLRRRRRALRRGPRRPQGVRLELGRAPPADWRPHRPGGARHRGQGGPRASRGERGLGDRHRPRRP